MATDAPRDDRRAVWWCLAFALVGAAALVALVAAEAGRQSAPVLAVLGAVGRPVVVGALGGLAVALVCEARAPRRVSVAAPTPLLVVLAADAPFLLAFAVLASLPVGGAVVLSLRAATLATLGGAVHAYGVGGCALHERTRH